MIVEPYRLRPYSSEDFEDPKKFLQGLHCAICGHHLPIDQFIQVESHYIHNDNLICLALIQKSGTVLSDYPHLPYQHLRTRLPTTLIEGLPKPLLVVGPPASGKTTLKRQLQREYKGIVLESELAGSNYGGVTYAAVYDTIQAAISSYTSILNLVFPDAAKTFVVISHVPYRPKDAVWGTPAFKCAITLERVSVRKQLARQLEAPDLTHFGWVLREKNDNYSIWLPEPFENKQLDDRFKAYVGAKASISFKDI